MIKTLFSKLVTKATLVGAEALSGKYDQNEMIGKAIGLGLDAKELGDKVTETIDLLVKTNEELIKANKELMKKLEDIQKAQDFHVEEERTFRNNLMEKVDRIVLVDDNRKKKEEK